MHKLVLIYTHGAVEITGTKIFVLAEFNSSKNKDFLVAMYLYNDNGVLTRTAKFFEVNDIL